MLSQKQYAALLTDLPRSRVQSRSVSGRSLSYVEAWDIKRTLIRIFGFGGFSADVLSAEHAFTRDIEIGRDKKPGFQVGYKVILRLTVPTLGQDGASYTEAAVGFASLPDLGEAHDMAIKTAESDALKRAAINLGTQFGLSLYNDGSLSDVVVRTAVPPAGHEADEADVRDLPSDVAGSGEAPALSDEQEVILSMLRSYATEADSKKRIQAVAQIKAQYIGTGALTATVEVGGQTMTLEALAAKVAAGAFLQTLDATDEDI